MVGVAAQFHGDMAEAYALTGAVMRCCKADSGKFPDPIRGIGDTCRNEIHSAMYGATVQSAHRCAAHDMLLDQRVVDHLLFGRRIAERLMREEFQC